MDQLHRLEVGVTFADRTGMKRYLVPVITPEGNIKILKTCPSSQPESWLVHEWAMKNGAPYRLKSVALTGERVERGAMFLKQAYEMEEWPEAWEEFQRYLAKVTTTTVEDEDGHEHVIARRRHDPVPHFPDELLPKHALDLRKRRAERPQKDRMWTPSKKLTRPADKPKGK